MIKFLKKINFNFSKKYLKTILQLTYVYTYIVYIRYIIGENTF
jgi:hypothetical protein